MGHYDNSWSLSILILETFSYFYTTMTYVQFVGQWTRTSNQIKNYILFFILTLREVNLVHCDQSSKKGLMSFLFCILVGALLYKEMALFWTTSASQGLKSFSSSSTVPLLPLRTSQKNMWYISISRWQICCLDIPWED